MPLDKECCRFVVEDEPNSKRDVTGVDDKNNAPGLSCPVLAPNISRLYTVVLADNTEIDYVLDGLPARRYNLSAQCPSWHYASVVIGKDNAMPF
ncbi:uncharacterized protein ARMOST_19619 [Armillaria ostoyae]|uniref:Uncharacterized protein n=1 Tax=Armillaria ostoyae TaxID=47428 RepID=A0A284S516_ARMOS|nr:uncharacterized protein ARMOST_19619 [Armillaria ostoyae]